MKKPFKRVLIIISTILIMAILGLFIYGAYDFYNDYMCSTTYDVDWFFAHHCDRYFK